MELAKKQLRFKWKRNCKENRWNDFKCNHILIINPGEERSARLCLGDWEAFTFSHDYLWLGGWKTPTLFSWLSKCPPTEPQMLGLKSGSEDGKRKTMIYCVMFWITKPGCLIWAQTERRNSNPNIITHQWISVTFLRFWLLSLNGSFTVCWSPAWVLIRLFFWPQPCGVGDVEAMPENSVERGMQGGWGQANYTLASVCHEKKHLPHSFQHLASASSVCSGHKATSTPAGRRI